MLEYFKTNNQFKKYLPLFMIMLSIILLMGTSYALLRSSQVGNNSYVMNVGLLEVTFQDASTSTLTLQNAYPMSDEEGMQNENELVFTVKNTGTLPAKYNIYIEETSTNPEFKSVIKFISSKNNTAYNDPKLLSEDKFIDTQATLNVGESATYKVKCWLIESADTTYMNKTFTARIMVETGQFIVPDKPDFVIQNLQHVWLGDSLIRGYGNNDKGFAEYFVESTGAATYVNCSVSGSGISTNIQGQNGYVENLIIGNVVNFLASDAQKPIYSNANIFIMDGGGNDVLGYISQLYVSSPKEVGEVDVTITTPTDSDTVIGDFEDILYTIKTEFPTAKLLYVNPFRANQIGIEDVVYAIVIRGNTLDSINSWLGINASTYEEAKPYIIQVFTEDISNLLARATSLFSQIPIALEKYGYDYLDLSGYYGDNAALYLQNDLLHITDAGYKFFTPYIIDKVNQMFAS